MKGKLLLSAAFAAALLFLSPKAQAAESFPFQPVWSAEKGKAGDAVDLSILYDGSLGPIGAFAVRVEYDPGKFEYVRAKKSPVLAEGYTSTLPQEDAVLSAYTMKGPTECLMEAGDTFTYRFRILEDADPATAAFSISVYEITGPEPETLGNETEVTTYFEILPPPSEEAFLVSLTPSQGVLEPEFSPDVFQYFLTVPFEVKEMTFLAEPALGASCRVNRKNLGAGGGSTDFFLTVTAEDGKSRQVYQVTVYREEQAAVLPTEKPTDTVKPTKTPKPSATPQPAMEKTSSSPTKSPPSVGGPQTNGKPGLTVQNYFPLNINNGSNSPLITILVCTAWFIAFQLSKPLAAWWCKKIPEPKGEEAAQQGDKEKDGQPEDRGTADKSDG